MQRDAIGLENIPASAAVLMSETAAIAIRRKNRFNIERSVSEDVGRGACKLARVDALDNYQELLKSTARGMSALRVR